MSTILSRIQSQYSSEPNQSNEITNEVIKSHNLEAHLIMRFVESFIDGVTRPRLPGVLALVDFIIGQEAPILNFFVQQTIFYTRNECFSTGPIWSLLNLAAITPIKHFRSKRYQQIEEQIQRSSFYTQMMAIAVPSTGVICGVLMKDRFQIACERAICSIFARFSTKVVA